MDLIDFLGSNLLNCLQKVNKKAKTHDWNKYNDGFWHNFFLKWNEEKNGYMKVNCKGVTLHLEVESQRKNHELFINATIHNFNEYNKAQIPCVELWCSWAQRLLQGLWEIKKRVKVQMCLVIYVPWAQLVFYVTWSKSFRKCSVNSWRTYLPRWDKSLEYFARHFIEIKSWLYT